MYSEQGLSVEHRGGIPEALKVTLSWSETFYLEECMETQQEINYS